MKHWPTSYTNTQGVSPEDLADWRSLVAEINFIELTLKKHGHTFTPRGVTDYNQRLLIARRKCEAARLICRRQDIESRWSMRWFNRQYRQGLQEQSRRWKPTPMLYDQYLGRDRRLFEG